METENERGKKSTPPHYEYREGVLLKSLIALFDGSVEEFGLMVNMSRSKIYSLYKMKTLPEPEKSMIFDAIKTGSFPNEKTILAKVLFPEYFSDYSKKNSDNDSSIIQNKSAIENSGLNIKSDSLQSELLQYQEEIKRLHENKKELLQQNTRLTKIIESLTILMNKSENK